VAVADSATTSLHKIDEVSKLWSIVTVYHAVFIVFLTSWQSTFCMRKAHLCILYEYLHVYVGS
jgi:hypothetical protein